MCIKVANSIDHWVEDCRDVTKAGGGVGGGGKSGGGVRVDVNGEVKFL